MIDSATHEASVAATAASAALPPFARISAPEAAVAGFPAAIPGCMARQTTSRCPLRYAATASLGRAPSSLAARWDCGVHEREGIHEPHQGREAGHHQGARPRGDGYRLAGSPDRDADAADQPAHGAPSHAQARPPLAPRAVEARRPPPPLPELPATHEPRGLPRPHQGAGAEALARVIGGGSLSERHHRALTQTSTLVRTKVEEEHGYCH